jgi:hypothetical protein
MNLGASFFVGKTKLAGPYAQLGAIAIAEIKLGQLAR